MISALVSAYYATDFLPTRLKNLERIIPRAQVVVICRRYSAEYEIAISHWATNKTMYDIQTTTDIPTLYKAWNIGIGWAKGDYLTSANCDDYTYFNGLSILSEYLDSHPGIDLVYGDCHLRDEHGIHDWKRGPSDLERGINRVGVMPLWRKSLHDRFGLFNETMTVSGDYEFWLRCQRGGAKLHYIPRTIGVYWKRKDSLEHRHKAEMQAENMQIREAVLYDGGGQA